MKENKFSYPINMFELIELYGISILSYSELASINNTDLKTIHKFLESDDGALLFQNNKYKIIYNSKKDYNKQRFTLAHELGHYLMNHEENSSDNDKLANCFARNLLCPAYKVNDKNNNVIDLSKEFGINEIAAEVRIDKIKTDLYYLKKLGIAY